MVRRDERLVEDEGLVREILRGNIDSFNILIGKYELPIFNFIYRMVRNNEAAQDITQEVFITLYNKLYTFKFDSKFSSWLYQIARNKTLDYIRKYKRVYEVNIEDAGDMACCDQSPEEFVEYRETKSLVENFLKDLNEIDRQILILKYSNKKITFYDISNILHMSEASVKGRYYRLKDKFKSFIKEEEKGCGI